MTQWIRNTTRAAIYARDTPNGQRSPECTYCGVAVQMGRLPSASESGLKAACLDHVNPRGGNGRRNLVVACWSCNASKGEQTPDEWEWSRIERGEAPAPPWRSRRPEPDLSLAERANLAIRRPVCPRREAECAAKLAEIDERRREMAENNGRKKWRW